MLGDVWDFILSFIILAKSGMVGKKIIWDFLWKYENPGFKHLMPVPVSLPVLLRKI